MADLIGGRDERTGKPDSTVFRILKASQRAESSGGALKKRFLG